MTETSETPAGTGTAAGAAPAGSQPPASAYPAVEEGEGPEPGCGGDAVPLRPGQGKDEAAREAQRDAWKRAQSAHSAAQRGDRGRRARRAAGPGYRPGQNRQGGAA